VLAPTDPGAHPFRLAHDFGKQPERISGPRKEVPVTSMVRKDVVAWSQVLHDPDRICLLTNASVCRAIEETLVEQIEQRLLESANKAHPAVQPYRLRLVPKSDEPRITVRVVGSVRREHGEGVQKA
jgi:hypothetical protein